jgi:probable F420-dependent oxidoreductase
MKFGFVPAYGGHNIADPSYAILLAQLVEEAGLESIWVVEHIVVPTNYASQYPYSPDGRNPLSSSDSIPDPLEWLAFVAAVTTKVRLGTAMLILPQHNPLVLAKRLATIDTLSAGRVIVGVGVGWLREESDALGARFDERGQVADEYIAVLRALWRDHPASFKGRFVKFADVWSCPSPAQSNGPPIVIGGHSEAAARRAGRLGDGFFPLGVDQDRLRVLLNAMRDEAVLAGRNPDLIEISASGTMNIEKAKRLEELGVSRLMISPRNPGIDTARELIERFVDLIGSKM